MNTTRCFEQELVSIYDIIEFYTRRRPSRKNINIYNIKRKETNNKIRYSIINGVETGWHIVKKNNTFSIRIDGYYDDILASSNYVTILKTFEFILLRSMEGDYVKLSIVGLDDIILMIETIIEIQNGSWFK